MPFPSNNSVKAKNAAYVRWEGIEKNELDNYQAVYEAENEYEEKMDSQSTFIPSQKLTQTEDDGKFNNKNFLFFGSNIYNK